MDFSNANFHHTLYNGLKMLGFEKFYKSNKQYADLEFNESTFLKGNQKAFEVVTYFLFSQLKNSDHIRSFRGCYPCLDKTYESNFRKSVINSFKELEKDPLFNYKFLPGIICNPGGDSFVSLYLAFLNYVLKKTLNIEKPFNEIDDLNQLIEDEKSSLMDNCMSLKEKTIKEEEYCGYFDEKLSSIKSDENDARNSLRQIDQELNKKFGTTDLDELMQKVKANFIQIRSHKLRSLYEQNKEVLQTETTDIENRTVNLNDYTQLSSPVDLVEIQKLFQDKLCDLKHTMNKENSNIDETIEKLDLKAVYYSSTNRILRDLTDDLEKKIDKLKYQTDEKKRIFLERKDVQELIKYVKSKINFNPPKLEFKAEKFERPKTSLPDHNVTTMDQTLANRSTEEDFNFSINLAEMTTEYPSNENDESIFQTTRNCIKRMPSLDNIHE